MKGKKRTQNSLLPTPWEVWLSESEALFTSYVTKGIRDPFMKTLESTQDSLSHLGKKSQPLY